MLSFFNMTFTFLTFYIPYCKFHECWIIQGILLPCKSICLGVINYIGNIKVKVHDEKQRGHTLINSCLKHFIR